MKLTRLEELSLEINKLEKTNSNPERLQELREAFQTEMVKLVDKRNKESKPKKKTESQLKKEALKKLVKTLKDLEKPKKKDNLVDFQKEKSARNLKKELKADNEEKLF